MRRIFVFFFFLAMTGCQPPVSEEQKAAITGNTADSVRHAGIVPPKAYAYPQSDTFTILTWNVEHFVDTIDNPYINNQRENNPKPDGRPRRLMAALEAFDADVVVLQEFENVAYLERMVAQYLPESKYQFFADAESFNWYQNVVLMSKLPLGVLYSYGAAHAPLTFSEEGQKKYQTQDYINTRMWSIDVLARSDYSFVLTGLHLKAGDGPRNVAMRMGQIDLLHGQFARFLREDENVNLLVVGDLNCTPDSKALEHLLHGHQRVHFNDPKQNITFHTHPSGDPARQLDYILPNTFMTPELKDGSVRIPEAISRKELVSLSDHLPVMATFMAREMEE